MSICDPCREAAVYSVSQPNMAEAMHKMCLGVVKHKTWCDCLHVVGRTALRKDHDRR